MTTLVVTGASTMLSGDMAAPLINGADTIVCTDGVISQIGRSQELQPALAAADIVIDAEGSTVAPGLIDSHCHVVLGD